MGMWMFALAAAGFIVIVLFSFIPKNQVPDVCRNDVGPMALLPTGCLVVAAVAVFVFLMAVFAVQSGGGQ